MTLIKPEISVVIVSYNTKELTIRCINSIKTHTQNIKYEIIVIDNNSTDDSAGQIKNKFPDVKIIRNKTNLGFGAANNQGANLARGKFLLFLNSDTYIEENSLAKISNWFKSHPNAGVVSCRLINPDHSLQYNCGFFPTLGRVFNWLLFFDDLPLIKKIYKSYHLEDPAWYIKDRQVDWVGGAFLFIRSDLYKVSGGFDEKMFMYGEEVELQMRIKRVGGNIFYSPITSVVHIGRASSNQVSESFTQASEFKGLKYIYIKHMPAWQTSIVGALIYIGILLRVLIFDIFKGKGVYHEILGKV